MAQIYVKPVKGRTPRHETTHRQLADEGDWWPDAPYTRRLLKAGDIVKATAPNEVAIEQSSESAAVFENQTTVAPTTTRKNKRSH